MQINDKSLYNNDKVILNKCCIANETNMKKAINLLRFESSLTRFIFQRELRILFLVRLIIFHKSSSFSIYLFTQTTHKKWTRFAVETH